MELRLHGITAVNPLQARVALIALDYRGERVVETAEEYTEFRLRSTTAAVQHMEVERHVVQYVGLAHFATTRHIV